MARYSRQIIAPVQAAQSGAATRFTLYREDLPARLVTNGLANAEKVTVKCVDGTEAAPVVTTAYADGAVLAMTATEPALRLDSPGTYELDKTVTAAASSTHLT